MLPIAAPSARRGLTLVARAATLTLALAHLGLLWQRIESGTLLEPLVLGRWAASLGLVLWLARWASRRSGGQGASARSRRGPLVFWVVVAVLHLQAGAADGLARHDALPAAEPSLAWFVPVAIPLFAAGALAVFSHGLSFDSAAGSTLPGTAPASAPQSGRALPRQQPRPPPLLAPAS